MPYITISGGLTLRVPTPGTRGYDATLRTDLWAPIAEHDHTTGKGVSIGTDAITNSAVTAAKLAAAVTEALCPAGTVVDFAGATAPDGWLLCDGSAINRTDYADLFTAIGTTFGSGNGSTTFNIPDARGRFSLAKASAGTGSTLGSTGGALDHTHSTPAHYHGMGTGADLSISASGSHRHGINTGDTGGGITRIANASGGTDGNFYVGDGATNKYLVDTATHTHASGDIAGRIGLVTGGVNGNSAMTSGANNPAYIVLNKLIKY